MTMRWALLPLIGVATLAAAQDGDRGNYGRPLDTPENRADMMLRFAARCVVEKVPSTARKVLETGIGSDDEAKRVKGLPGVGRECFQPQWPAFPATPFRDAIAEVTYRKAYRTEPVVPDAAPPASFAIVPDGTKGTPQQEAAWQLGAIARCTVFAGPHEAHRWIVGPRNVDEEQHRFDALKPAIARCVPPQSAAALTARNFRGPVAAALLARATHTETK